jgi:protein O-GlcNAcase / histone acetyltransferase
MLIVIGWIDHGVRYVFLLQDSVYEICRLTCDDGSDGTSNFPDHPQLIADRHVGAYLSCSSDMCFVVEGVKGVCGYVLASHDAASHFSYYKSTWLPLMQKKYKKSAKSESLSPAEKVINEFYSYKNVTPESLLVRHPSIVRIDVLRDHLQDSTAPIRALACAVAALKVTGSCGIFAQMQIKDANSAEAYRKLGFFEIPCANSTTSGNELIHMGRII